MVAATGSEVVDLVPFLRVSDVTRSIGFYEALGFRVVKTFEPGGRLEFAGLESTSAAKVMLARVDNVQGLDPDGAGPGFLYLYTRDLDAFCKRLLDHGIEPGEITGVPGPGPSRQMCVRDPDGYGHMVAELWPGSVGCDPRRPPSVRASLLRRLRTAWPANPPTENGVERARPS